MAAVAPWETLLQGLERNEQPRPEAPVCRHHPLPGGRLTTIAGSGIVEHRVLTTYISTITEKPHIPQSYIPRRTPHDSLAGLIRWPACQPRSARRCGPVDEYEARESLEARPGKGADNLKCQTGAAAPLPRGDLEVMTRQAAVSDPCGRTPAAGCGHARKRLRAFSLDNVTTLDDPTS